MSCAAAAGSARPGTPLVSPSVPPPSGWFWRDKQDPTFISDASVSKWGRCRFQGSRQSIKVRLKPHYLNETEAVATGKPEEDH